MQILLNEWLNGNFVMLSKHHGSSVSTAVLPWSFSLSQILEPFYFMSSSSCGFKHRNCWGWDKLWMMSFSRKRQRKLRTIQISLLSNQHCSNAYMYKHWIILCLFFDKSMTRDALHFCPRINKHQLNLLLSHHKSQLV